MLLDDDDCVGVVAAVAIEAKTDQWLKMHSLLGNLDVSDWIACGMQWGFHSHIFASLANSTWVAMVCQLPVSFFTAIVGFTQP